MSPITTHVLDTAGGQPAQGVAVVVEHLDGDVWTTLGRGTTDADGRILNLRADAPLSAGVYRLRFSTGDYFRATGREAFYPEVQVMVQLERAGGHYHLPLLLSPFGYTTYRGS